MRTPRRRNDRGAAAVEFALVAMILVTLVVGVIQFSIWFWGYQSASHAAREAARFAAVEPCDTAAIEARGKQRADESAPIADGTATVTVSGAPSKVGDDVTVQVRFSVLTIGLIPGFEGAVDRQATARVENIPAGGC